MARNYFIKAGEQCFQTNDKDLRTYLTKVKEAQSDNIMFDPNTQGFRQQGPICDLTRMSSAEAEQLLNRMNSQQEAETA